MIGLIAGELAKHDVELTETIRVADHNVLPGVTLGRREGDEWPGIRRASSTADILIFGTPIWLGQMSSLAKRVHRAHGRLPQRDRRRGANAELRQGRGGRHRRQ